MTEPTAPPPDEFGDFYDALEAQCLARGIQVSRRPSQMKGSLGVALEGATRSWELHVDCQHTRLMLPRVWLAEPRGLLPHVGYNGVVCVNDGEGLSIDRDRLADVAAFTVLSGFDLLEKWSTDVASGKAEFFNEFEGYWLGLPGTRRGRVFFEVDKKDRRISAYDRHGEQVEQWLFAEGGVTLPPGFNVGKAQPRRALYVHLESLPLPPAYPQKLTHEFIDAVRAQFSPVQAELWHSMLGSSKNGAKQLVLLVSAPRAAGGLSLVGVVFTSNRLAVDQRSPVIPLTLRRQTSSYMRERGGASLDLLGRHVAVLGCGAVGAIVADSLAAAGVGKLTLVDGDEFSEDNVFRHVLEPIYVGVPKVYALKHHLERRYPGLKVLCAHKVAQDWETSANLDELNGVVFAFGAPTVEREFSRLFKKRQTEGPVVFTWLEALDLGGHSVLMWSKGEGCLDCLYRNDEGQSSLLPRTAFLRANQYVTRNLTGCASVFVPYGALQSRRTGLMAAEHILSALTNQQREPSYRHWVGDGRVAAEQGLETTEWWRAAASATSAEATHRVFGRPCKFCRVRT